MRVDTVAALGSVARFRDTVVLPEPGRGWADPCAAWHRVVGQICAVGSSRSWEPLEDLTVRAQLSVAAIRAAGDGAAEHVHRVLAGIRVRYCSPAKQRSQKAEAIAWNAQLPFVAEPEGRVGLLDQLRSHVGDSGLDGMFSQIQAHEARRLLIRSLRFFGPKSASDFLLGLGLADSLLAFDTRILNLLIDGLGWEASWRSRVQRLSAYEELEAEVLERLARPLGLSGLHLDRLLFQRYPELRRLWVLPQNDTPDV